MKAFLQEVAEDLIARFGDNLQHSALIFNNKRPAVYLQKYLANSYQKTFWSPTFYTVQEFFAQSETLRLADPYTQFFTLHKIYNRLLAKEGLEPTPASIFYPNAKIILSDFAQIDNDLVEANKLFEELADISEINLQFDYLTTEQIGFLKGFWASYNEVKHTKQLENFIKMWRRMPALYHDFHHDLFAQGLTTMGQVYRKIANGQHSEKSFSQKFNPGKLIFIGFNALNRAEAKVFKQWQDEEKALFYFDTDEYYLNDPMQEAGLFLRKNIFQTGLKNELKDPTLIKSHPRQVEVYQVNGHASQAKILNQIVDIKNSSQETTAIILANESLLIPVLQTIPTQSDKERVDLNVTMGFPLLSSSIFGLADLWIGIQSGFKTSKKNTVNHKSVDMFLSHPLITLTDKKREEIRDIILKDQLAEIEIERLQRQKGLIGLFFEPINESKLLVKKLQEIIKTVAEKLKLSQTLKKIDAELFFKTTQELNLLHDNLVKHLASETEISFVLSLIQKSLQSIAVPLEGAPLEGIQVMGLLESRNLNFDHVVILGANEGIIPKTNLGNTFIPDSLRRVYGLPVLENQDAISAYMVYRLVQRAEKISFVYNNQTDDSNTGEISRFIKQLEYESGFNFKHHELKMDVKTDTRTFEVSIEKTPAVMAVLNRYLSSEKYLSASALNKYIANPVDFFYSEVAKIKEPDEVIENVEANIVGTMLHYVMEHFYATILKESSAITKEIIQKYRNIIPALLKKSFADAVFKDDTHAVKLNGMQKVIIKIVEEYTNVILEFDAEQAPFTIIALEQKGAIPFEFEVNGQKNTVMLYGIIDRVDLKDGVTRIVDYKTGSDELKYADISSCFDVNSKKQNKALVQTLFYTHVYEQLSGYQHVEPNLYVLKKMRKDGIAFTSGKESLTGQNLVDGKAEFLNQLRLKLGELFNPNLNFTMGGEDKNFIYSPYMTIMGKKIK